MGVFYVAFSIDVLLSYTYQWFLVLIFFVYSQFSVRTYDTADPSRVDVSFVNITVIQNPSGPQFINEPYSITISGTQAPGSLIYNTTAVDSDGVSISLSYYLLMLTVLEK